MTNKENQNFFIFAIVILILFFSAGSSFVGSIFGEEFDASVAMNGGFSFPEAGLHRQVFFSEYTKERNFFFPEESIVLNFAGTQHCNWKYSDNRKLTYFPYTPESGSGSIRLDDLASRQYKFGMITYIPKSFEDTYGDTLITSSGYHYVNPEKYCSIVHSGNHAHLGCAKESSATSSITNTDRVWGVFTMVNDEASGWNENLSNWYSTIQQSTKYDPSPPFSTDIVIPKDNLKNYYNTIEVATVLNGDITSTLTKFEIYVEPKECSDPNYTTRVTSLSAGNTISLSQDGSAMTLPTPNGEFKEFDDIVFCHTRPVIKETAVGAIQDFFPYDSLANDGTITVPSGETWVFFWRALPSSTTLTFCEDGSIYNEILNKCVITPSIEYVCTDGVFDSERLACLVQANSEIVCKDTGAVYIQEDDICRKIMDTEFSTCSGEIVEEDGRLVCLVEPELEIRCTEGNFDESIQKCIVLTEPEIQVVCKKGNYDAELEKCIVLPEVQGQQGEIGEFPSIYIFGLVVVLVIGYLAFTNKKTIKKWFK